MKRVAILSLMVVLAAGAFAQKHTGSSTWVHVSGGDATSWALIRLSGDGKADVGDVGGIHIGEVTKDELIIVRDHKGYISTDGKLMNEIMEIRKPLDKAREEHLKARGDERGARLELRGIQREQRQYEKEISRLERERSRRDADNGQIAKEVQRIKNDERGLDGKASDLQRKLDTETKKLEVVDKNRDALRSEIEKKLEKVFDSAISSGRAHPM